MTTDTPDIVLHQWFFSPFCGKVRKVLAFKHLPYRTVEYGGLLGLKVPALSASGKLPVLDYDGIRFQDSSAIARMLDRRHPEPALLPPQVDRHLSHLLEDWADESLYWYELWLRLYDADALEQTVVLACEGRPRYERWFFKQAFLRYRRTVVAQGLGRYDRQTVLENFRAHLRALEGRLEQTPWLAGQAPSMADIAVSAQLDEVVRTSAQRVDIEALPRLTAWLKRCSFGSSAESAEAREHSPRAREPKAGGATNLRTS